jgi:PAS domain S-box-containing protein
MTELTAEGARVLGEDREKRMQSEMNFRRLLDALPAAAYTCDRNGLITYFNKRAAELWGRTPRLNDPNERFGGAPKIFSGDGAELTHENSWMARAIRENREFGGQEIVIGRADGTRIAVLAHASALRDEDGNVIGGVNVLVDIDERKRAQEIQDFLAQASVALAHVADYHSTLERIASLAVPFFADWFGVHVREPNGTIRRIAVRHLDAEREREVEELYRAYPPGEGKPYGAVQVLLTGKPIFASDFEALLPGVARDERHLQMLRHLGLHSFLCVPMRSRGQILGTLTFATAESRRRYNDVHFRAAEDLASRAAIAIENAQLIEALKGADKRKDEFLAMLAHELRNPLAPVRNAARSSSARRRTPPICSGRAT